MRFRTSVGILGALLALVPAASAQEPALESDTDKTLYALGLALSQKIVQFQLDSGELDLVQAGFRDGASQAEPRVALDVYGPKIDEMLRNRLQELIGRQTAAGAAFIAEVAAEPGVETTDSGMLFQERQAGEGAMPGPSSTVLVHYEGTLIDGTVFDSSRQRGEPARFSLNGVIPCFREGLQKLRVGGKARLVCPSDLAYGPQGSPPRIPGGATLVFEVELIEVVSPPAPTP